MTAGSDVNEIEISDYRGVRRVKYADESKRWSLLLQVEVGKLAVGEVLALGPTTITRIS